LKPKTHDRDERDREPTFFNCSNILDSNWKFTSRFEKKDKIAARKRIKEILLDMESELRAMTTHHVAEKDLTRRFSQRDLFKSRK
jgi:hypothetical protein